MNSKLHIFSEGSNKNFGKVKCIGRTTFLIKHHCFLCIDSKNKQAWKKKKVINGLNHPLKQERTSVRAASLHAKRAQSDAPSPTEGNWVMIFWGNIGHAIHLPPLQKLALTWCESFGSNNLVCNKMNFISACLLTYFSLWPYWFQIKQFFFFFLSGKQTKGKRSEPTERRHLICYETVRLKKVFTMRAICPSAGPKHLGVRFSWHIKELVCLHAVSRWELVIWPVIVINRYLLNRVSEI